MGQPKDPHDPAAAYLRLQKHCNQARTIVPSDEATDLGGS
jgi:hypothetical protein